MPNNAIRIGWGGTFTASAEHNPAFNERESPVRINGGTKSRLAIWNSDLYPAQNSTWTGVTNAVPERGANAYTITGGSAPIFSNGGMSYGTTISGAQGIRIGTAATAGTPHESDLSTHGDGAQEYLVQLVIKRHTDSASPALEGLLYALTDGGANAPTLGAKCQIAVTSNHTTGVKFYLCGIGLALGWLPTAGKLYALSFRLVRVPGGTDVLYASIYNVTDNVEVWRDVKVGGWTHVAFVQMVAGGENLGNINTVQGFISPFGFALYDCALSRLTTSGRDGLESHYDYVRELLSASAAGRLS